MMTRYKRALLSTYSKELLVGGLIFSILFAMSMVQLIGGEPFAWKQIEPFNTPDFWNRVFWSALTFVTLGAALYRIYFYKIFSMIFGSDRSGYRKAKRIIWLGLMYMNYQIFPVIVDIANFIVSFIFNSAVYVVYISPMLMVGILLGVAIDLIEERKTVARLILQR